MEIAIARALVLWIALWLSLPLMWQCYAIANAKADGNIGWFRFAGISFLWALFFMLGAIG